VSCAVLLAAPQIGPAAYWLGAAIWGIGGLGFGAVSMLAAMAEAHDASTGRASGLVVLWFSLGFTVAPPAFGWLLDRTDAYGPGFAILIGLYVAAAVIMLVSRGAFRPLEPAASVESH
jgi:nitrate/nitrite transporter NarK